MSAPLLGVIDYGRGNLRSVEKALQACGASTVRVSEPHALASCDALVLPGVGAFGDGIRALRRQELVPALQEWIAADRPFLGICLGYQMLFSASAESPGEPGLGIFAGEVRRFVSGQVAKIPHMGWNQLILAQPSPLYHGVADKTHVYFVHSYFPCPEDASLVTAWCEYGGLFAASIGRGRVQAVQFHPEKSQDAGLKLLSNFLTCCVPS